MVQIPKFYYKTTALTNKYRFVISAVKYAGFKIHPAFVVDGVEKDYIYLSAFEGSAYDVTASAIEVNTLEITAEPAANGNLTIVLGGNYIFTVAILDADTIEGVVDKIVAAGVQTDYQGTTWTPAKIDASHVSYTAGAAGLRTTMARVIPTIGAIGSGTASAADATTLTCSGKTWTVNGWAGYIVRILTGTGAGSIGVIASNTATVLTVADWLIGADPGVGSTFEITPTGVTGTIVKTTPGAGGYVKNDAAGIDFAATTGDVLSSVVAMKPLSGWNNPTATLPNIRQLAKNRGTGWNLMDFNSVCAVQLLFIIRNCTLNSQAIYAGVTAVTDATAGVLFNNAINTGFTAGIGTNGIDLGNTSGECPSVTHYKTGEAAKAFSIFGIENFWGNIWKWVAGINIKANRNPWIADHDFVEDTFAHPYVNTGFTLPSTNDYGVSIVFSSTFDYLFLPLTVGGSSSQYLCDYYYQDTGNRSALLGGHWADAARAGAFYWALADAASGVYRAVGSRLAFK